MLIKIGKRIGKYGAGATGVSAGVGFKLNWYADMVIPFPHSYWVEIQYIIVFVAVAVIYLTVLEERWLNYGE